MSITTELAEQLGANARRMGKPMSANPYGEDQGLFFHAWKAGWRFAGK
jgi:hypothetical protein